MGASKSESLTLKRIFHTSFWMDLTFRILEKKILVSYICDLVCSKVRKSMTVTFFLYFRPQISFQMSLRVCQPSFLLSISFIQVNFHLHTCLFHEIFPQFTSSVTHDFKNTRLSLCFTRCQVPGLFKLTSTLVFWLPC